ncbi:MAG: TonB-dependent receptor [Rhizomicrobium sp.]
MKNFAQMQKVLLGSVSALAIGALIGPALAQDTSAGVETVVVTGIRASLESAQAIKQNSDQIVDSISEVDIGALPDRNVAEALQRVPGVTLQRNQSPNDLTRMGTIGNSVYVRGLAWVKTLVDGRDEFTAVDGRSLSFADVSADLLSGVDVYKSPDAKMIEGGVGGTIDLRTRKPFDQDGLKIALSGDYTYGNEADKALPSVNGLISDRWNTSIGEIGALLSVDWQDQVTRTEGINVDQYECWNQTATTNLAAGSHSAVNDPYYGQCSALASGASGKLTAPTGWAWRQLDFTNQRLAANAVFQWRPNDKWEITLSGLNSYAYSTDLEHYVYNPLNEAQVAAGTYNSSNYWVGGPSSTTSIDTRAGTGHNRNTDFNLDIKFNPTDALAISADVQFVESSSPYRNITMYTGLNGASLNPTLNLTGDTPQISWTDPTGALSQAGSYDWLAAMDHLQDNVAHAANARIDASYTLQNGGLFGIKSVDAGFRTEQKVAVSRSTGYNWGALCPTNWGAPFAGCPLLNGTVSAANTPYTAIDGSTVSAGDPAIAAINKYATLFNYGKVFGNSLPSLWLPSASLGWMDTQAAYKLFSAIEPANARAWDGVQNWSNWEPYASIAGYTTNPATTKEGIPCKGQTDFTCLAAYENLAGGNSGGNRISTQDEQTYAGYFQANYGYDTFLGYDIPVDGNIGLRIVRTEDQVGSGYLVMPTLNQNSCVLGSTYTSGTPPVTTTTTDCSGFNAAVQFLGGGSLAAAIANEGATVVRPAVKSGYTDFLPSFNFRARLTDQLQGRLAYSETIVRPDFSDTNSSASLNYNFYNTQTYQSGIFKTQPSGYGGNPYLKPMRARNYDASLEWYFAPTGSLTMSLFHKDLSDYIYTKTVTMPVTDPQTGQTEDFQYTTYANGSKGKVEGFELAYTQFYDQLPGFWGGFGLQANYTKIYNSGGHNGAVDVTSAVAIANSNNTTLPLEGMSNDSYNAAIMYSKYSIDARLAWNWRSRYLSSSSDANTKLPVWLENYGQLDGSVFYSFMEHYKIGVQVTNIAGDNYYTDMGYSDFHPRTNWIKTDRKYAIVVRTNW